MKKRVTSAARFGLAVGLACALVFASGSSAAAPSALRKGPFLQDLGPEGVSIRLELDPPGRAEIEVEGPAGDAGAGAPAAGDVRRVRSLSPDRPTAFQTFPVTGLQPKTAYRYRVVLFDGAKETRAAGNAGEGTFSTAPPPGDPAPVSFMVYGDNRTDHAAHANVVRAMTEAANKGAADFLLNTGDFVEDGANELHWQRFFEIERPLLRDRCLFAAVGNHELTDLSGEAFVRFFGAAGPEPTERDRRRFARSVRWGELRILFLNAMDTFASSDERKWLEAELARTAAEPGVTFRFVVLHHGPYCSGPHGNNPRLWNSKTVDLLRDHRIDLVWSGHDHLYERGEAKGLKYIVSGGGGAPLYPVRKRLATSRIAESVHHFIEVKVVGQRLDLIARRLDGSVLDRCGFAKGGAWECDKPAAPGASPTTTSAQTSDPPPKSSRCGCGIPSSPVNSELALTACALALAVIRRRARPQRFHS